jgi:hypothetical protein
MSIRDILTDGVIIAIVYGCFRVVELWWGKRKQDKEIEKIDVETFILLRGQVLDMEAKIVQLRRDRELDLTRIENLENERDATKRTLNELRVYVRGLLRQLDAQGVQYDKPRNGLLDTGDHQAVK